MEFSTIVSDLKHDEVTPDREIEHYLELVERDIADIVLKEELFATNCPACDSDSSYKDFNRLGLVFRTCGQCFSDYILRRPLPAVWDYYYNNGKAYRYWFDNLWKKTKKARLEKILIPQVEWMASFGIGHSEQVVQYGATDPGFYYAATAVTAFDVNLIYPLFVGKIADDFDTSKIIKIETDKKFDAVVCLDFLDRSPQPQELIKWCAESLRPGGRCFLTGVLSTGLESLVLGELSPTLLPPDRLNRFSYEGLLQLVRANGFTIVEMSTPGVLDMENIKSGLDSGLADSSRLTDYFFNHRKDGELLERTQQFLQENRLSSRYRMVIEKS